MALDRCPRCAAAVPVGAPWCTLCFADLRPQPASVRVDPLTADLPELAAALSAVGPPAAARHLPPEALLVGPPAARVDPTWPCRSCGAAVPMAEDDCPGCGTSFLAGADTGTLDLPLLGGEPRLGRGAKAMVMAGGALAMVVLFLIAAVLVG